ncbi:CYTH and CHAD domain-containing protein [Kocuria flava]|uniref:CYTH and CHAD domain-containing protein n=1 Tax=Kocuria flava TaxID=446860 RepID=UPI001FF4F867|nr:CYTH and CHAD domain-containing protein [Kocuria flava]MCJ8505989.1 CYTH and CHAD domain-containing protein [Kocuria flava]
MTATTHREIERKYELPEGAGTRVDWGLLEGLGVAAEPVEHRMEAVYYDTEDMALGRRLVALRRRRGGADDGWHVKHHEPSGRHELQVPLLRSPERMPAAVRGLLAGLTGGRPLVPIATLRTVRRVLVLRGPDGTDLAEVAADDVEAVDERTGTVRTWAEWEVELLDGTLPEQRQEEVFAAVETVLRAAGGRPSASRAKIARALGAEDPGGDGAAGDDDGAADGGDRPQQGGGTKDKDKKGKKGKDRKSEKSRGGHKGSARPESSGTTGDGKDSGTKGSSKQAGTKEKPGAERDRAGAAEAGTAPADGPGPTTGEELLRTLLGELAERLVLWDFKARLDVPDAVHQMRIGSRSLRSVLRAAAPLLEGTAGDELALRLRELARALSAARDAEVTAELLPARAAELSGGVPAAGVASLRRTAQEQAEKATAGVRRRLGGREHLQLLADVQAFAAAPPVTDEARALPARDAADRMLERSLHRVERVARRALEEEAAGAQDAGAAPGTAAGAPGAAQDGGRSTGAGPATGTDAGADAEMRWHLGHLHSVRKAVKRVRYVEAALRDAGIRPHKAVRRAAADAHEYQDALGRIMDAVVVEQWLARTARSLRAARQDRYAVGLLHGAELVRLRTGADGGRELLEVLLAQLEEDLG